MTIAAMKLIFEREHCANNPHITRKNSTDGSYVLPSVQDAWAGFQTGYAAAISEQEKCEPVLDYTVLHQYADDYSLNYSDLCVMVRAAITHPAPVPAGWQLVPVEPTKAMLSAGWGNDHLYADLYKTMLQAAPKPGEMK